MNEPQTEAEIEALRCSVQRGRPYGTELWVSRTAKKLGLEGTLRAKGRPPLHAGGPIKGSCHLFMAPDLGL